MSGPRVKSRPIKTVYTKQTLEKAKLAVNSFANLNLTLAIRRKLILHFTGRLLKQNKYLFFFFFFWC